MVVEQVKREFGRYTRYNVKLAETVVGRSSG